MKCEWCPEQAAALRCPGDQASHRHGGIHTLNDGLRYLCRRCGNRAKAEWQARCEELDRA